MAYEHQVAVTWGDSDPAGLAYYPCMLAWFNDAEHALFRRLGFGIDRLLAERRTTFVMGELGFRFTGPAAYNDRVTVSLRIAELGARTLRWDCEGWLTDNQAPVMHGHATRVHVHKSADGTIASADIPDDIRQALLASAAAL